MRSYLVLILTVLAVLLFDWWGQSQLSAAARQGTDRSLQLATAVREERWADADELLARMEDFFDDRAPLLSRLVEHGQVDEIEVALAQLSTLVSLREQALALTTLDALQLAFEGLSSGAEVNWNNLIAAPYAAL